MRTSTLAQQPAIRPATVHEHGWATESRHRTSEGTVRYVRCGACGVRRIDLELEADAATPPRAASVVVASPTAATTAAPAVG